MIYTHTAAAIVALLIGLWGGWQTQGWRLGEQIAASKAAQAAALVAAIEGARTQEASRFTTIQKAQNDATKRAQIALNDADTARAELDRLRDTIRAQPGSVSGESAAACYQRADKLSVVVAECAGFAFEVARDADAKANDVRLLLDAWPR